MMNPQTTSCLLRMALCNGTVRQDLPCPTPADDRWGPQTTDIHGPWQKVVWRVPSGARSYPGNAMDRVIHRCGFGDGPLAPCPSCPGLWTACDRDICPLRSITLPRADVPDIQSFESNPSGLCNRHPHLRNACYFGHPRGTSEVEWTSGSPTTSKEDPKQAIAYGPPGAGGHLGPWRAAADRPIHPHQKILLNFTKEARTWRPVLGTQNFFRRLLRGNDLIKTVIGEQVMVKRVGPSPLTSACDPTRSTVRHCMRKSISQHPTSLHATPLLPPALPHRALELHTEGGGALDGT